jgi:hypothetical protein
MSAKPFTPQEWASMKNTKIGKALYHINKGAGLDPEPKDAYEILMNSSKQKKLLGGDHFSELKDEGLKGLIKKMKAYEDAEGLRENMSTVKQLQSEGTNIKKYIENLEKGITRKTMKVLGVTEKDKDHLEEMIEACEKLIDECREDYKQLQKYQKLILKLEVGLLETSDDIYEHFEWYVSTFESYEKPALDFLKAVSNPADFAGNVKFSQIYQTYIRPGSPKALTWVSSRYNNNVLELVPPGSDGDERKQIIEELSKTNLREIGGNSFIRYVKRLKEGIE